MSDLISRSEAIQRLIQETIDSKNNLIHINTVKRLLQDVDTAYDVDNVVQELEELEEKAVTRYKGGNFGDYDGVDYYIKKSEAIEIVKQGSVSDDVCEWKLEDEEANLYLTGCQQRQLIFDGTPKENGYRYCPYCGKNIKVVE